MPAAELTLYVDSQLTSPYAMSVFVALHEKGLPFEVQHVDLEAGEHLRPPFRDRSLTRRVPTVAHGSVFLSESSAITEYLEEVFPPPAYPAIYPGSPLDRARARQVQAWLRSDLMPIREERPTTVIFHEERRSAPLSAKARAAVGKLFAAAQALGAGNAENLFGGWCIADTELALMLNRLVMNGDEVPDALTKYALLQWQRPSVQAWVGQHKG